MAPLNNPRFYGAAGASIIAVSTTARYVAKWRRRRSQRRRAGERGVGGGRVFIGLDLSDPDAKSPRPCDYAILDADLACAFGQWDYRENGAGIIPKPALGRSFILAIDGPQGLAGDPGAAMRQAERLVNAPGHSPYALPEQGTPFAGFIRGSVRLFHRLVTSGSRFRLLGYDGMPPSDATLLEVFPGAAWKLLATDPLPPKASRAGREARAQLLADIGVRLPDGEAADALPTHDQLDAAIAAWTAYKFWRGEVSMMGRAPELDDAQSVIREGYIVQPAKPTTNDADEPIAPV